MPFTDADRNMLVETHTLVKTQAEDIKELKKEDKVLHHRINVLRNFQAAISTSIAGIAAWFKSGG